MTTSPSASTMILAQPTPHSLARPKVAALLKRNFYNCTNPSEGDPGALDGVRACACARLEKASCGKCLGVCVCVSVNVG